MIYPSGQGLALYEYVLDSNPAQAEFIFVFQKPLNSTILYTNIANQLNQLICMGNQMVRSEIREY